MDKTLPTTPHFRNFCRMSCDLDLVRVGAICHAFLPAPPHWPAPFSHTPPHTAAPATSSHFTHLFHLALQVTLFTYQFLLHLHMYFSKQKMLYRMFASMTFFANDRFYVCRMFCNIKVMICHGEVFIGCFVTRNVLSRRVMCDVL